MSCDDPTRRKPCPQCCGFFVSVSGTNDYREANWLTAGGGGISGEFSIKGTATPLTEYRVAKDDGGSPTPDFTKLTSINAYDETISFSCAGSTIGGAGYDYTFSDFLSQEGLCQIAIDKINAEPIPTSGEYGFYGTSVTVTDIRGTGMGGGTPLAESLLVTSDTCGGSSGTSIIWDSYGYARASHGRYRICIKHPSWCGGDGNLNIKWRERTQTLASGITYVEKEETISPTSGTTVTTTSYYDMAPPSLEGTRTVYGPSGARAIANLQVEKIGHAVTKRGWHSYTRPTGMAKVFKRQTSTGNLPECPLLGYPARDFAGTREYVGQTNFYGQYDPGGQLDATGDIFENDENYPPPWWIEEWEVPPTPPELGAANLKPKEGQLDLFVVALPWRVTGESETQRDIALTIPSGCTSGVAASTSLSEEYMTDEMINAVDDWVDGQSFPPSGGNTLDGFDAGSFLSRAEHYYAKQKCRYRLQCHIPKTFDSPVSFDFKVTKTTIYCDTGEVSTTTLTETATFDEGENIAYTDWQEIDAPLTNDIIKLSVNPALQPTDIDFSTGPSVELA